MPGSVVVITAPAAEPITLSEAKLHLREDGDESDTLIAALVTAARRWVEETCGRALVTQTLEHSLDAFPCGDRIELPRAPLVSVTSVKYHDADLSTVSTLSSSLYQVDTAKTPGVVVLKDGESWPTDTLRRSSGVVIRYVAGYGAPSAVPADIKHAIKLLVGQMFTHREPEVTGTIVSRIGFAVDALLAPHRVW